MNRILTLAVALTAVAALNPTIEAKDNDGHKGGGGGGGRSAPQAGGGGGGGGSRIAAPRPQMRSGGNNIARIQGSQSAQVQRVYRPQGTRPQVSRPLAGGSQTTRPRIQRNNPSVALAGRNRSTQERGANWNERRRKLIAQQWRAERAEDRREAWEDRREDWKDHHDDWDHHDHHYYVPYNIHRYWDHDHIYYWNNNPYRWYNNAWVIVQPDYDHGYDYGDYGYSSGGSLTARVQEELAREGYDPGPIDGVLGGATRDAIIDFQRDHELPVTGRIDTPLLRELGL